MGLSLVIFTVESGLYKILLLLITTELESVPILKWSGHLGLYGRESWALWINECQEFAPVPFIVS